MNHRLEKTTDWLKEKDISFCMLTSTPNVFYLTGFYTEPHERLLALFVFQDKEPFLVCPAMEISQAKASGWEYEIVGFSDTDQPWDLIKQALTKRNLNVSTVAIEKEHMNIERYENLVSLFSHATFISAEEKLHTLRMIKDEKEAEILREAAKLADYGVEVGVNALAKGKTELDVLGAIEFELKKKGIRQMSFDTMVLTGLKTASPHGKPGLAEITPGQLVLFDLGVVLDGYCSDITRTVAFGSINEKQEEIYQTVLKAQLNAVAASRPGAKIGDIDTAARSIITEAGYGDYFTHRVGHGLGIDVHEFPSLNSTNKMELQVGMAYTIEPGIYLDGVGGVRIEDDLIITETGAELLTKFPKELQIIKR
ncbi:M24 family metallopeptidase [Bacillus sp. PS06]|uniref:M24 family metallopeptidase n=1 Tax=Bacillus sp. PS06 TaxID=2764176 RepID=UPI00178008E3|nr:Xaa-Pro peptidase family protein [Bacillus sp. PS06]MBD8068967.1 aminopeptidase P family protein [Bacillus sp. PS06]